MNLWLLVRNSAGYGDLLSAVVVADNENDARVLVVKAHRAETGATAFLFEDETTAEMIGIAREDMETGRIVVAERAPE